MFSDYYMDVIRSMGKMSHWQMNLQSSDEAMDLAILACTEELGEVAGLWSKIKTRRKPVAARAVLEELGDLLWSVMALTHVVSAQYDTSVETILEHNIKKLEDRYGKFSN